MIWHGDQSITFRVKVDGLDEIVWWVLSMGPHCIMKKPRELAMRVRELAQKTAGHYSTLDQSKERTRPGAKAATV